jgi:hypothetical protein
MGQLSNRQIAQLTQRRIDVAKKNPGVSVTAVISPLDRLKLEVLVRDEILTRGQNSSVSSMVNTFLGIMLSSSLMQKKILACAEQQVAQDIKLGRTDSPAQRVLAAYRGASAAPHRPEPVAPAAPPTAPAPKSQFAQPEPDPNPESSEPVTQPTFSVEDLKYLNPALRVASKVRPAGYPGSEAPLTSPEPAPAEPAPSVEEPADLGDAKSARGLLSNLLDE